MATRAGLSPVERFIAEHIYSAPGHRLAIASLWRAWQRFTASHGFEAGKLADLVSAVRRAHPECRRVKARSGQDVHNGDHLTGMALR